MADKERELKWFKIFTFLKYISLEPIQLDNQGSRPKKYVFGESFPKCVRFWKTKGEIRVKKDDFRGDLEALGDLDFVWESATPPNHIWENFPKKNRFFWTACLERCFIL